MREEADSATLAYRIDTITTFLLLVTVDLRVHYNPSALTTD
jgi:hypothetical protein